MSAKIRKIAVNGMRGRKKDTLLLIIVITMSFFFITLAAILQGSFQKTENAQRLKLYGSWQAAYMAADDDILHKIEQLEDVSSIGKSYLFRTDSDTVIGTYNQALSDMGEFSLLEGSYPQKPGEIILESSQASELGLKNPVGQTISVVYKYILEEATEEEMNQYTAKILEQHKKKLEQQGETDTSPTDNNQNILQDWLGYDYNGMMDYQHRTVDWETHDNGITLTLSNLYHINYFGGEIPGPEEIRENGILKESILRINIKYTVSGVIADYSGRWDVGNYTLANSFITEEAGSNLANTIKSSKLTDLSDFIMADSLNLFLTSDSLGEGLYDELAPELLSKKELENAAGKAGYSELYNAVTVNNARFRKNNLAYPIMKGSTESTLLILIISIIFLATAVSVFQIFLSQIKRRSKKIALLKSIGATNGQTIGMIVWEGVYLLLTSLPAGLLSGVSLSYGVLQLIKLFKHSAVIFYVNLTMVGLGLLAGIISVIIGMMIPLVFAARIPLIGTMSKPPKQHLLQFKSKLLRVKEGRKRLQSFKSVSVRHISLNKGKMLLNLALSVITISILLSTVFLCYMSFRNYNKSVAVPERPDYTLEIPYGLDYLYMVHCSDAIDRIPGINKVNGYRRGDNLHIYFDKMEQDETLADFYKLIPASLSSDHFAPGYGDGKADGIFYNEDYVDKAFLTNMYGIDMDSDFGKQCMNSITEGKLDKKAFSAGQEVILVLPRQYKGAADAENVQSFNDLETLSNLSKYSRMKWLLQNNELFELTLNKRYKDLFQKNENVKAGDTIIISVDEEVLAGDTIVTQYSPYEVKVAGIITYFPNDNIWPFDETGQSYAVICSSQFFSTIYKGSENRLIQTDNNNYFSQMVQMYSSKFGISVFQIYTDRNADRGKTDKQMIEYAGSVNGMLYSYRESNQLLYNEALNNALIIGLLGFATSAVAIFILYNILASMAIQDKVRIGILQSIGVTNKQLIKLQLMNGLVFSLIALVLAHIVVILIMFLTPFGSAGDFSFTALGYFTDVFRRLELYPWNAHFLICTAFIALTVFVYYIAAKKIIKQSPIENMNR